MQRRPSFFDFGRDGLGRGGLFVIVDGYVGACFG